jgi:hypothetical protein
MHEITDHSQLDDAVLNLDVSDDALERAGATGLANAANPTMPWALICIPFVAAKNNEAAPPR